MFSDLKFACRSLLQSPGFAAVAICTLALGIGATVAIFSLVNAVLLTPLPYAAPDRLARVYTEFRNAPDAAGDRFRASTGEYRDLVREARSWQSLDAWQTTDANLAAAGEPLRITAAFVTGGLLATLGVPPALGRAITPQDDAVGATPVAVISYGLWQRAFGGARDVVGRDVLLNGVKRTVIGVMPAQFGFPFGQSDAADLWAPLQIDPSVPVNSHEVFVLGRLASGVSLAQAKSELDGIVRRAAEATTAHHLDPRDHPLGVYALTDEVVRTVRPALRMLFGAVCLLLAIACVNVANLLLARAEARQNEIAVRSALGAGLPRLARQFAAEGVLLALGGAALGVPLAAGGLALVKAAGAGGVPQALAVGIDLRVLAFALGVSLVTGVAFGLAPLAHVVRRDLHGAIKSSAAATTKAAGTQRFRQALIVGQLALALVLLAGTARELRRRAACDEGRSARRAAVGMTGGRRKLTGKSRCADHAAFAVPRGLTMKTRIGLIVLASAFGAFLAHAQEPVVGAADPESLFKDSNPVKNKNKQAALHIERELLQCGQWDRANEWLTDAYHQHNPNAQSGLKGVVYYFTQVAKVKRTDNCGKLTAPVVAVMADGDYVTVLTPRKLKDPHDPSKEYYTSWFDTWRFVDGKADEHWDPATINAR